MPDRAAPTPSGSAPDAQHARRRERLRWLLPPLIATLAIAFQYAFDVPKDAMIPRPTPEEKAAAARAKKKAKQKAKRARKKKSKASKRGGPWRPRGAEERDRLRREYSTTPLADEPRDPVFRRHHEALLRSAATKVRGAAIGEGERVPMQIRPSCRTLRCELELCAERELLAKVAVLLPELRVNGDEPLWHELRELEPRTPKSKSTTSTQQCRRWLVDFAREDLNTRMLSLASGDEAD